MLSFSRKSQPKSITEISEITHLREAIARCSFDSFLVFDFDNTLAEATKELGSDQWFEKLMAYASGLDLKGENACDLVITIYRAVQAHVRARAVETEIVKTLKALHDVLPTLIVTARGIDILEPTVRQIKQAGMNFFRQGNDIKIKLDIGNDVNPAYFYQGQIYCNGNDKGKCLDAFFKWIEMYPRHIVMVDDKAKHLERVKTALQDHVKKFTGLRYSFLDEKAATVDMEKARIQLNEIYDQLPVKAKIAIDKLNIRTYQFPKTIFNSVGKPERPVEITNKVVHHF